MRMAGVCNPGNRLGTWLNHLPSAPDRVQGRQVAMELLGSKADLPKLQVLAGPRRGPHTHTPPAGAPFFLCSKSTKQGEGRV